MPVQKKTDWSADITAKIIAQIEQGAGEFIMPWHRIARGPRIMPHNKTTGAEYNGINTFLLSLAALNHDTDGWASFKQWQAKGRYVAKGEKGVHVCYYGTFKRDAKTPVETAHADGNGQVDQPFMKVRCVFNEDQLSDYESSEDKANALADTLANRVDALDRAEAFIAATGATITESGGRACYRPATDDILLPRRELFTQAHTATPTEAYYSTALHELTHWTHRQERAGREVKPGKEGYAFEELVAELGAAFLCRHLGITLEPRADHAQYLNSWLQLLSNDKRALFRAAAAAQRAVDYLVSCQPQEQAQAA